MRRNLNDNEEKSVSQSISHLSESLSIPPISFNDDIANVKTMKTVKTKTSAQTAVTSMKMFTKKIAKTAAQFGHNDAINERKSKEFDEENVMDINDNKEMDIDTDNNKYATIVIYPNKNNSIIPESQIKQSATPPPQITPYGGVNKFLDPESTQTMIVKKDRDNIHTIHESKSLDAQLTELQQSADNILLSEDSTDSSEEEEEEDEDDEDGRDPIDVSEEDDLIEKKRHKKNKTNASNISHNRTMIINDNLDIDHIISSMDD